MRSALSVSSDRDDVLLRNHATAIVGDGDDLIFFTAMIGFHAVDAKLGLRNADNAPGMNSLRHGEEKGPGRDHGARKHTIPESSHLSARLAKAFRVRPRTRSWKAPQYVRIFASQH